MHYATCIGIHFHPTESFMLVTHTRRVYSIPNTHTYAYTCTGYEDELHRMQNVRNQRLNLLQRIDHHTYDAVVWLEHNRHCFKKHVFEPILLSVSAAALCICMYTVTMHVQCTCTHMYMYIDVHVYIHATIY